MTFRKAWLMDCSINGMPVVQFQERGVNYETSSINCLPNMEEALIEISRFEKLIKIEPRRSVVKK